MRLIFIPGFGEEVMIFDKIHPYFAHEKLFVDNWTLLGEEELPQLNVLAYAYELCDQFNITKDDIIIGHSMGGWVAWFIKHVAGCRVVQIASWTDSSKVVAPIRNPKIVYWTVRSGLYLNPVTFQFFLWQNYYKKPSQGIYSMVFKRLIRGNKKNAINQLRLIFNPVSERPVMEPDLRIHSHADTTIQFPDEPTHEVPGDHFNLWTNPEEVVTPILDLLATVAVKD